MVPPTENLTGGDIGIPDSLAQQFSEHEMRLPEVQKTIEQLEKEVHVVFVYLDETSVLLHDDLGQIVGVFLLQNLELHFEFFFVQHFAVRVKLNAALEITPGISDVVMIKKLVVRPDDVQFGIAMGSHHESVQQLALALGGRSLKTTFDKLAFDRCFYR